MCVHSVAESCLTLCNPMDCSLPGSSVHGTLQARMLELVVISSSRGFPDPGIELVSPAITRVKPINITISSYSYHFCVS